MPTETINPFVPNVHFEQIPIKNLVSNQDYQRNLSQKHIEKAAAEFDLYQINPVKVSRRNGINYVFNVVAAFYDVIHLFFDFNCLPVNHHIVLCLVSILFDPTIFHPFDLPTVAHMKPFRLKGHHEVGTNMPDRALKKRYGTVLYR